MSHSQTINGLRKYDFARAYQQRFVVFGTPETDAAAALAGSTNSDDVTTKEQVERFLHSLWGYASKALDHGEFQEIHRPLLEQLEIELAHKVMTLRGQQFD
jgi:hypothetical protein